MLSAVPMSYRRLGFRHLIRVYEATSIVIWISKLPREPFREDRPLKGSVFHAAKNVVIDSYIYGQLFAYNWIIMKNN